MRPRIKDVLFVSALSVLTFTPPARAETLAERADAVLADALAREQGFVKVHAAEALIALGEKDEPRRVFRAELPTANEVRPYRIGVWRVLAASAPSTTERATWIARTEAVILDPSTSDRLHAVESLGKLGHAPAPGVVRTAIAKMVKGSDAESVFPLWVLHLGGDPAALPAIVRLLDSSDPLARLRAAYVLRWLDTKDSAARAALARTAEREPSSTIGYPVIVSAALAVGANPARTSEWTAVLEDLVAHGATSARYNACLTLMRLYTAAELGRIAPLLDATDGDARIGAAWAILAVTRGANARASASTR